MDSMDPTVAACHEPSWGQWVSENFMFRPKSWVVVG